ncbi:MAG: CpaF family protein, partial [Actinomycetota bacterium]
MGLYERLAKGRGGTEASVLPATEEAEDLQTADPLAPLKRRIHQALLQALGPKLYDINLSAE